MVLQVAPKGTRLRHAQTSDHSPPRHTAELLTSFNRPHRHPIPMLLAQLTARLDRMGSPAGDPPETASILNRAALMEVQFGRPAVARRLCLAQIDWVGRHVVPTHGAGQIYLAFQPWINLARLDRMLGQGAEFATRLRDIRYAFERRAVCLGGVKIDPEQYDLIDAIDPYFPSFLRNSYLTERLIAALGDPDRHAIDTAIARIDIKGSARSLSVVSEARMLHALRHRRDSARAEIFGANPSDANPRRQLALRLRCLALHESRLDRGGTEARTEIEQIVRRLMTDDMDPLALALFSNAAGLLAGCDPEKARPVLEWGISRAGSLGDCMSAHWLETVQRAAPPSPQDIKAFVDRTWMYALYKQKPPMHRVDVVDGFTQRLLRFVG